MAQLKDGEGGAGRWEVESYSCQGGKEIEKLSFL